MRLDKFLAQGSVGRRKDVRVYIKDGKVKVNKEIVLEPSIDIDEISDIVQYNDGVINYVEKVYYMFNKPAGCVTATKDKDFKTVFDYFTNVDTNGLFHVGRLDKDTEGLLLLTNDGDFEHHLMHPDNHMEKTYFLWAFGLLSDEDIKKLEEGLYIGKNEPITKPAKFKLHKQGGYKEFKDEIPVELLPNIDSSKYNQPVTSGYLTISEGRKHQVKRMLKAVGCYVVYLERVAIGEVVLDNNLERGAYRKLNDLEFKILMANYKE